MSLARLKRDAKDLMFIAAVIGGGLLIVALILGSIAFEVLKGWALIKFIFFW